MLRSVSSHWALALSYSWPWLVVLAVLNAWDLLSSKNELGTPPSLDITVSTLVLFVAGLVASSSIAVSWHRFILIDEHPSTHGPFRLDQPVWAYLLRNIVIGAICLAPLLIISAVFDRLPSQLIALWVGLSLLIIVLMLRLSVSLPAIAIGKNEFGLKSALEHTKGNNLPLFGLLISVGIIILLTMLAMAIILTIIKSSLPSIFLPARIVLGIPVQLTVILINTTMQTSLYGYFVERREF
jgi:hypothetical protein